MRAVVQRVSSCTVRVDTGITGSIERGILIYLGVGNDDTTKDLDYIIRKTTNLRIFPDLEGKMNRSVKDINGEILIVSQFTLCADTRKGNRPSYNNAALPEFAEKMYNSFVKELKKTGLKVETGQFRASMEVDYVNDGPVTILIDSKKIF
ncbi:MAG: D-tyrosyl-tRNA(Tyr) deacylase [Spirochaetes bacterium]|nr:MAG: D-tyrosyl-tRNA(Tyr) deacylase [Spirochaetota bacterium]